MLDEKTFSQAPVGDLMKAFVNVQIDAQHGEGPGLAKRYGIRGYPTLLIVDAEGGEIDRIGGYLEPDGFTKEIERILRGENTLPVLRRHAAEAPDDVNAGLALASRLSESAPAEALSLLEGLAERTRGKDRALEARAWLLIGVSAGNAGDHDRAMGAFERVLDEFADTDSAREAALDAVPSCLGTDPDRALAFIQKARKVVKDADQASYVEDIVGGLHLAAYEKSLERRAEAAGDEAELLNLVAWECFERRVNVAKAVTWARKAVEKSDRDPAILDTLANLLFLQGETDEAIALEEEALAKVKVPAMKSDFEEVLAKFRAVRDLRKARSGATTKPEEPEQR